MLNPTYVSLLVCFKWNFDIIVIFCGKPNAGNLHPAAISGKTILIPTCQVGVSRFYQSCRHLLPPSLPAASDYALNCELQISVGTAGPQPDAGDNVRIDAR